MIEKIITVGYNDKEIDELLKTPGSIGRWERSEDKIIRISGNGKVQYEVPLAVQATHILLSPNNYTLWVQDNNGDEMLAYAGNSYYFYKPGKYEQDYDFEKTNRFIFHRSALFMLDDECYYSSNGRIPSDTRVALYLVWGRPDYLVGELRKNDFSPPRVRNNFFPYSICQIMWGYRK